MFIKLVHVAAQKYGNHNCLLVLEHGKLVITLINRETTELKTEETVSKFHVVRIF